MNWIAIDTPEDITLIGEDVLCFDGCDISIDYVEYDSDTGVSYMANGTEPTHWMHLPEKPATDDTV